MSTAWAIKKQKKYPPLENNISADVVIIGGGLCGVLSAYCLTRIGKTVALLEGDRIGNGVTALTTAFITQAIDTSLSDLITIFGSESARLVWQSGADAIDTIESIVKRETIACDFKHAPVYIYARTAKEFEKLTSEHAAATDLGFTTTLATDTALPFENEGYITIPNQAMFHPLKFINGVIKAIDDVGAQIFEHTKVASLSEKGGIVVTTDKGSVVRAKDAIVATYSPFNNPKVTHFKKGMYRSYVIQARMQRTDIPQGMYCDLSNPYNYFRVDRKGAGGEIILGGADHRKELPMPTEKNFHALHRTLDTIMAGTKYTIMKKWTGPILEPSDGLPLIGKYAPHRYTATAFSGNGMTYSAVAAILFRDIIERKRNPLSDVYDPTRKLSLKSLYAKGIDYGGRFFGGAVKNMLQ